MPIHQADDVHVTSGPVSVVSVRNRRETQQDAVLVSGHLCAVADGLGGHDGGALAAVTALEALNGAVTGPVDVPGLVDGVVAAQLAVSGLGTREAFNPGTTLVAIAVAVDGSLLHGVWVGDSRAYLVDRSGLVSGLTVDHREFFGGLSRALGAHGWEVTAVPDVFSVPVGVGASVLLCTDGVSGPAEWHGGDEGELAERLPSGLFELVHGLAALGSDNATAVLIDVDLFVAQALGVPSG